MLLSEIKDLLKAEVLSGEEHLGREVFNGCGSDFMSDVLAFSKDNAVLLTGLLNPQVIRTAEMMDFKAVIFVRGKTPPSEIILLANEKEIVVLKSAFSMFTSCGLLYKNGLGGEINSYDNSL